MKKLLTVLAVVALVAISFTSCNNGTPAPSATIPEAMHGTWGDASGATTLEISADSFVSKTDTLEINYTDSKLFTMTVSDNSVEFKSTATGGPTTTFTVADEVITETSSIGGSTEYTPVDATV